MPERSIQQEFMTAVIIHSHGTGTTNCDSGLWNIAPLKVKVEFTEMLCFSGSTVGKQTKKYKKTDLKSIQSLTAGETRLLKWKCMRLIQVIVAGKMRLESTKGRQPVARGCQEGSKEGRKKEDFKRWLRSTCHKWWQPVGQTETETLHDQNYWLGKNC